MLKWYDDYKKYKDRIKKESKVLYWIVDWVETIIVALALALVIRQFAFQTSEVMSGSMIPTLQIRDRVIVNKLVYRFREMKRGEIVLFGSTIDPKKDFIKRLIGLPGDKVTIRNGILIINDQPVSQKEWNIVWDNTNYGPKVVPQGQYFFLGDNRPSSYDSRFWGFVPKSKIIGKAFIIVWPPFNLKLL